MRIAIAAPGPDSDGEIGRRGARAVCYLVFDETATLREVIQNPFQDFDHAVGVHVADLLADKSVDIVAAAHLGSGFTSALDKRRVRYAEYQGVIAEVAKQLAARFGPHSGDVA
ncbi:MAG: NifB/NifX family molybdenum-iron cluster-binding protein [Pseudomonadota bacterium]|nr:NifB/NifX family molybdenum-iron cluster-binding protein [Pseudomonadota bacterium]